MLSNTPTGEHVTSISTTRCSSVVCACTSAACLCANAAAKSGVCMWSLSDANSHPMWWVCRVLSLVLRGVCLMRESEIDWMFGGGAAHLQPLVSSRMPQALALPLPPPLTALLSSLQPTTLHLAVTSVHVLHRVHTPCLPCPGLTMHTVSHCPAQDTAGSATG